jgi:hypothetical protein
MLTIIAHRQQQIALDLAQMWIATVDLRGPSARTESCSVRSFVTARVAREVLS